MPHLTELIYRRFWINSAVEKPFTHAWYALWKTDSHESCVDRSRSQSSGYTTVTSMVDCWQKLQASLNSQRLGMYGNVLTS